MDSRICISSFADFFFSFRCFLLVSWSIGRMVEGGEGRVRGNWTIEEERRKVGWAFLGIGGVCEGEESATTDAVQTSRKGKGKGGN